MFSYLIYVRPQLERLRTKENIRPCLSIEAIKVAFIGKSHMLLNIVDGRGRGQVGSLSIQDLIAWDEAGGKPAGKE